jgi:hypothetical protein
LLDIFLLCFALLYGITAVDISRRVRGGGTGNGDRIPSMEWGAATALAVLAGGLQVVRWRARAWVERTLVSSDAEAYAARWVLHFASSEHCRA